MAPLLCANATSIEALAVGRALQAVGGCARMMFARVVARDLHGRARAAGVIGLVTMLTALATAVIPGTSRVRRPPTDTRLESTS